MFEPERLLAGLPLNDMTPARLVAEIQRLAAETREKGSKDYYNQRMGAIKILADLAAERLQVGGEG